MLLTSAALSLAALASLLTPALANPTGLTVTSNNNNEEAPQYCCNCEDCTNCDQSCPDPGCTLFVCGGVLSFSFLLPLFFCLSPFSFLLPSSSLLLSMFRQPLSDELLRLFGEL